jgi:hypothetical protein
MIILISFTSASRKNLQLTPENQPKADKIFEKLLNKYARVRKECQLNFVCELITMKSIKVLFLFTIFAAVYAITVEEAWNNYKANPKKPGNPGWVKDIPDFATFKQQWDTAKAHNAKYATTQDAWKDYKVRS